MDLEQERSILQALEAEQKALWTRDSELWRRLSDLQCERNEIQNQRERKREEIDVQKKKVKLAELCDSLRRNDASLVDNPTECSYALPVGFAKSLGEALLENTTVSTISIYPNVLLPIVFFDGRLDNGADFSEALAYIEPLIRYVKSSNSLRELLFRSRCDMPSNGQHVETALMSTLLDAVRKNPQVDSVEISYPIPLSILSPSLMPGMNLKTLNVDLEHFNRSSPADEDTFASSFQFMTTLQHVTLSGLGKYERLDESILACLASGCASLQELKLAARWYVGPFGATKEFWTALAQVFYSATMLRHLELHRFNLDQVAMEGLITCLRLPDGSGPSPSTISKLSFRLHEMKTEECRTLQGCLPHMSTIRELHVKTLSSSFALRNITPILLAMVRQSETICVFSVKSYHGDQLFSETQLRCIDAYCQRNQFLIQLTTGRRWDDYGDDVKSKPIILNAVPFPSVARTAMRLSPGKLLGVISKHDPSSVEPIFLDRKRRRRSGRSLAWKR